MRTEVIHIPEPGDRIDFFGLITEITDVTLYFDEDVVEFPVDTELKWLYWHQIEWNTDKWKALELNAD